MTSCSLEVQDVLFTAVSKVLFDCLVSQVPCMHTSLALQLLLCHLWHTGLSSITRIMQGNVLSGSPWYNLSCQSPMPNPRQPPLGVYDPFTGTLCQTTSSSVANGSQCLKACLCTDLAFRLGSCLAIHGELCSALLCSALLCSSLLCCAAFCSAAFYSAAFWSAAFCSAAFCSAACCLAAICSDAFCCVSRLLNDICAPSQPLHESRLWNCAWCLKLQFSKFLHFTISLRTTCSIHDCSQLQLRCAEKQLHCTAQVYARCMNTVASDQQSLLQLQTLLTNIALCAASFRLAPQLIVVRRIDPHVCAGSVVPGTSASVEIFTADLLIPQPGIQASFTYKLASNQQTPLELWCWFEPSNSPFPAGLTPQGGGKPSLDVPPSAHATTTDSNAQSASGISGRIADAMRHPEDYNRQPGSHKGVVQAEEQSKERGPDVKQQRVLAMLQPEGCIVVCPPHLRESSALLSQ